MSEPHLFERVEGVAIFRPVGTCTLLQARQWVATAIADAKEQGIGKLLVVTTGLTGFESPSIAERHQAAREWADAAGGQVIVAMVVRPELIDPDKFGVVAASNFGLVGNVFHTEAEAMTWLRESA